MRKKVDNITKALQREGWSALAIHGDKSQQEHDNVLSKFRNGKTTILDATDVAARGLDVEDVKYVINYDYPNSSEDYIHTFGKGRQRWSTVRPGSKDNSMSSSPRNNASPTGTNTWQNNQQYQQQNYHQNQMSERQPMQRQQQNNYMMNGKLQRSYNYQNGY
ncbi:hypothetical protein HCN44_003470 [Aphidius gifuensis]|uniref:Helicase C-terminal domain-containing protein n=1 Tax=Aphidius gifuensis TaxID=684658 RepID=A0A834XL42_APHGI|nr:hypothetical protein HCN44_003470 [Aphidius gifuensis]